jgi:hypothetical protein
MRLTSTLRASAAAFGVLAGFAMTPDSPSRLERAVTPYAVAVAWAPGPEPSAGGARADDWEGRMTPEQAAAHHARAWEQHELAVEQHARAAAAHKAAEAAATAAKPAPRKAETTKPFAPKMDFVTSTFGVPKRDCPEDAGHAGHAERPRIS